MPRWNNRLLTSDKIQQLKREAVLKAAGRAFSKRGYHNTSLDDVAKSLRVSKGTLYNYVKDKQEILSEFHKLAGGIGERAFAHGRDLGGNGAEMLRNILLHYIQHLTEELGACGALMEFDALRPEDRADAAEQRDRFTRTFVEVIETGIADGSLRAADPKLAVFTFMGAINWMPRWYSPSGRFSSREVAEHMTSMLLSGLLVVPVTPSLLVDGKPLRTGDPLTRSGTPARSRAATRAPRKVADVQS